MLLRFTTLDDRRHVLEVERDGHVQRAELETHSTLVHDLTHLALESCADVDDGFFVALARGAKLEDLAAAAMAPESAARIEVERAVVVLQSLAKVDEEPAELHARVLASLAIQRETPPAWFTVELVAAVKARLRELLGRWRATPHGRALEIPWERVSGSTRRSHGD